MRARVSLLDPRVDPNTAIGVYLDAITFARNEAYSRDIAFHVRKGCRANVQTRDPETGWCYKNGGKVPWGYRAVSVRRSEQRANRVNAKQIWLFDETPVGGRPLSEWVRHCLVELAGKGMSARKLCGFCEQAGLPCRNGRWTKIGWCRRLQPRSLIQYCGHAVWGAHRDRGAATPAADWLLVENAHPALITPEQAIRIAAARRERAAQTPSLHGCIQRKQLQ